MYLEVGTHDTASLITVWYSLRWLTVGTRRVCEAVHWYFVMHIIQPLLIHQ